jgi:2-polyprenyl-6-methoxyphenol hydroxylase-like FAD-dependent oxidoreductase
MTQVGKVVVAGGGIGGLTLALALARGGVEVEVHEKYDHLQSRATGFTIWSYAVRHLLDLGVDPDTLARLGSPIEATELRSRHGRLIESLPVGEASRRLGAPTYDIQRHGLQEALIEALGADRVKMGSEVVGVEQDATGATVLLQDGGRATGDLVIGADGAHSTLRDGVAGRHLELRYSGFGGWGTVIPFTHELLPERHHVEIWEKGSKGGVADVGDGHARWYVMHRAPAGGDAPVHKEEILAHIDGWYELLGAAVEATPQEAIVRTEAWDLAPMTTWIDGRVVLLGDAAHATTPFAAMGACMAIEDASLLGRLLLEQPWEQALPQYERERKKRAEEVVKHGRTMGRISQLQSTVALWLRDEFLAHVPPPKLQEIAEEMASGR